MEVKKGWIVNCINNESDDYEEIQDWIDSHPEFKIWDQEFFEKEIISTGCFVAETGGGSCPAPESAILFSSREVAEKYSLREPTVASGLSEIEEVYFIEIESEEFDIWESGADYFFNGRDVVAFKNLEDAQDCLTNLKSSL